MIKSLWRWAKKLALFVWLFFMLMLGVRLAMDNSTIVTVSLFGFDFPKTSLGMAICASLLIGAVLGFATNYLMLKPGMVARKRALKKADREVAALHEQRTREQKLKE